MTRKGGGAPYVVDGTTLEDRHHKSAALCFEVIRGDSGEALIIGFLHIINLEVLESHPDLQQQPLCILAMLSIYIYSETLYSRGRIRKGLLYRNNFLSRPDALWSLKGRLFSP